MKILVVGAHPADPIDLAGGTIAMQSNLMLDEVGIASMTDGMNSHSNSDSWEERGKKIKEFEKAANTVGSTVVKRFSYSDEPLVLDERKVEEMIKFIRFYKPDMVITHHPNEFAHWDHAETGKIVCRALKGAMKRMPAEGRHWVPMVYFFAVHFRPESARLGVQIQPPDLLVDIGQVVHTKVDALMCYESQGHNDREAMMKRMNSYESEMGRADGLDYSEGFIFYYPLKRAALEANFDGGFYNKKQIEI